jgi:subtilisin family serine protease
MPTSSTRAPAAAHRRAGSLSPSTRSWWQPGVRVRTADRLGTDQVATGTSISAPHVAGALALLLSAHPGSSAAYQVAALLALARDLGASGADNDYGFGRLDGGPDQRDLGGPEGHHGHRRRLRRQPVRRSGDPVTLAPPPAALAATSSKARTFSVTTGAQPAGVYTIYFYAAGSVAAGSATVTCVR